MKASLIKLIAQQLHLNPRGNFLVKHMIYGIRNWHMNAILFIYFMNTVCRIISFCNHVHFQLRHLHGIAFAYHRAEHSVAAELRVSRNKEISEIS